MPLELIKEIEKLCSEHGFVVKDLAYAEPGLIDGRASKEQMKITITKRKGAVK